jgi:hypothetical protein
VSEPTPLVAVILTFIAVPAVVVMELTGIVRLPLVKSEAS